MSERLRTFAFRVDASRSVGLGHIMRCLALAESLKRMGARTLFIYRDLPGFTGAIISAQGHECLVLPVEHIDDETAEGRWPLETETRDLRATVSLLASAGIGIEQPLDWCVVDHYKIGRSWHSAIRAVTRRIMIVDDLADRDLDGDLLLNQNLSENAADRYAGRITTPSRVLMLIGPRFALLRPEFARWRASATTRNSPPRRVLIAFGGSDAQNITSLALETLLSASVEQLDLTVAIGAGHPARQALGHAASGGRFMLHVDSHNMAELMVGADLAVGGGGVMTWERLCLGLPAIVVALAHNQRAIAETLAKRGLITYLGEVELSLPSRLQQAVSAALDGRIDLERQGREGMALVDGEGAARVAEELWALARLS